MELLKIFLACMADLSSCFLFLFWSGHWLGKVRDLLHSAFRWLTPGPHKALSSTAEVLMMWGSVTGRGLSGSQGRNVECTWLRLALNRPWWAFGGTESWFFLRSWFYFRRDVFLSGLNNLWISMACLCVMSCMGVVGLRICDVCLPTKSSQHVATARPPYQQRHPSPKGLMDEVLKYRALGEAPGILASLKLICWEVSLEVRRT